MIKNQDSIQTRKLIVHKMMVYKEDDNILLGDIKMNK